MREKGVGSKADDPSGSKQKILKRIKADDPGRKQTIHGSMQTIRAKADDLLSKRTIFQGRSRRSLCQSRRSRAKADDLKAESGRSSQKFFKTRKQTIFRDESRRSLSIKEFMNRTKISIAIKFEVSAGSQNQVQTYFSPRMWHQGFKLLNPNFTLNLNVP